MNKLLILMLFGVLFVPMNGSAKANEVLYCRSELATGFAEENSTWRTANFKKERFTIKVIGDFEKIIGLSDDTDYPCKVSMKPLYPTRIACYYKWGDTFFYDKRTKRFLLSTANIFTYLGEDTPILFAGTCQKF